MIFQNLLTPTIRSTLVLTGLIAALLLLPALALSADKVGMVTYSRGDAWILHGKDRQPAAIDLAVYPDDVVITDASGRVKLKMADNSDIYVGRTSRITIRQYEMAADGSLKAGMVDMLWGQTRFVVSKLRDKSEFKVRTKAAVLGVRGTGWAMIVPLADAINGQANLSSAQLVFLGNEVSLDTISSAPVRVVMLTGTVSVSTPTGGSYSITAGSTTDFQPSGQVDTRPTQSNDMNANFGSGGSDSGQPAEGGTPPAEGSTPPAEGGTPPAEGGTPPAEGGTPPAEGGTPPAEGGTPPAEGGTPPAEGGTPPAEGGTPPAEGGTPPAEGGTPPPAGGTTPPPSGTTQPASPPPADTPPPPSNLPPVESLPLPPPPPPPVPEVPAVIPTFTPAGGNPNQDATQSAVQNVVQTLRQETAVQVNLQFVLP